MKTESPLSGTRHTVNEYEAAKTEPVILAPQLGVQWKAPHFVWQVRNQLGDDPLPGPDRRRLREDRHRRLPGHDDARLDDAGTTEKWVYAAARAPNLKDTDDATSRT